MTKKRRLNQAVSEVVGVILLLGITIGLFGFLNYVVFSYSFQPSAPSVNLIGSINRTANIITIEHNGGESLDGNNTKVGVTIELSSIGFNAIEHLNDINDNDQWNLGETVEYTYGNIPDEDIRVTVVDSTTNTLILSMFE